MRIVHLYNTIVGHAPTRVEILASKSGRPFKREIHRGQTGWVGSIVPLDHRPTFFIRNPAAGPIKVLTAGRKVVR